MRSFKEKEVADDQLKFALPSVLEHVVMPGDTIQGLCLRYRVSAVELRRHNNFSGEAYPRSTDYVKLIESLRFIVVLNLIVLKCQLHSLS